MIIKLMLVDIGRFWKMLIDYSNVVRVYQFENDLQIWLYCLGDFLALKNLLNRQEVRWQY